MRTAVLVATLAASACAVHATPQRSSPQPSRAVRELRADLERVFGAPIMDRGTWAVDVRSLDTGERLYSLNAGKLMMPASNMKILTLAAAAERLGWDYRFTTTLETGGTVVNGVLHGDLIVRGHGDPTMNARDGRADAVLSDWAQGLRAAGISSIDGRILGDDQAFDDEGVGAGWAWDYLQYGYAAPVGALAFNESVATLTLSPGPAAADPVRLRLTPGSGFMVLNRAVTGTAGSDVTLDYRRHIDRATLEVTGSMPAESQETTRNVAVVNPTLFFAQAVKDGLAARGIAVSGEAADLDDVAAGLQAQGAPDRRVLVSTESPPLRDIGAVLMKVSQNLYAETLLKALGAADGGLGTAEGGRRAAQVALDAWSVPRDAYVMYDGSGLSRYNYLTAETVTTVLTRMHRDPRHHEPFVSTLPIAGADGTLASRLKRTRAERNAAAKTGSISNARALSGFVRSRDGEMLVFSILANDFVIPAATVVWIIDLGVEILSNFTRR